MKFTLDINYPFEKMERSRQRMEARNRFQYIDRVPVNYCVVPRYFAPLFGLRYLDFFKDAETQYYWLLQFARYQIENIPADFCTGPVISVHPYFDNAIPPSGQGAEVGWTEESPLRALPTIHTVEQMEACSVAPPAAGLRKTTIEWWLKMKELAADTRVTFNGQNVVGGEAVRIEAGLLGLCGLSPHMLAIDLVGEDFYWWMLEYPESCHRFLDKITQGEMAAEKLARQVDPRPRGEFYGLAEDSAQIMSARLFKEFCIPYTGPMFDYFGRGLQFGRGIHMCGNSTHLHQALRDDLRMTSFDIFGYLVPPEVAAANLGRINNPSNPILLWGNINPMLMLEGSKADVKAAAHRCLAAMAPGGGFMLGDGANVCPGTPLESFYAIMEAAEEYGLEGDSR